MTDPEPLEPAQRIVAEPTDDQGKPLGWRAADLAHADLSDDDYAAQFTRHEATVEVVPGSVSVDMDRPVRRTITATLVMPDAD